MSEADTSNNQPLPEPIASMEDSAANVPEASGASQAPQIVHLSDLRNLRELVQPLEQEQPTESDADTTALLISEGDESPTEMSAERRSSDADWFALAQKMRQRNRRLHEQVTELRQALKEKQEALHLELMRSQDKDALLIQQAEEINTVQAQLARLFHALESSHQAAQRQQILIETLSEQFQSSQERVAQLERECALTQQRYNDQSQQLLQAGNTCRELRMRLHRQQRQTLQFKAALEKSLEMTSSSNMSGQQPPQTRGGTNSSFFPRVQPIRPWSADPEFLQDQVNFDPLWNRPIAIETLGIYSSQTEPSAAMKSSDEPLEKASENLEQPTSSTFTNLEETNPPTLEASDSAQTRSEASQEAEGSELELERQLLVEMASLAEASGLSESQPDLAQAQVPLTPESETNLEESDNLSLYPNDIWQTQLPEEFQEQDTEEETLSEEPWENFVSDELEFVSDEPEPQNQQVVLPQSNWPSPVLYPLRRPKKRRSLAAIELPSFPRYHPS
jgi:hypothetical protein